MKKVKPRATIAALVLIPPMVGSIAYLGPFRHGFHYFVGNALYIATASIIWWPFSLFLKRRTFVAGLLGMHGMMSWFLFSMWMHWGDDLGWILYLPNLLIGCVVGIIISEIARKANEWIHRTAR